MSHQLFLPNLSDSQRQLLKAHNICAVDFTSDTNEPGFLVSGDTLPAALAALNMKLVVHEPTAYQGIYRLTLAPSKAPSSNGSITSGSTTIADIVAEMQRLQTWANLTDAERNRRHELTSAVQQKQQLLGELTERLNKGGNKLRDIGSHVESLLAHALPGELESALKDFRTACIDTHTQARAAVDTAMNELQAAHEALKADLTRQRISPEETLNASKATLSRAQKASELTLPVE